MKRRCFGWRGGVLGGGEVFWVERRCFGWRGGVLGWRGGVLGWRGGVLGGGEVFWVERRCFGWRGGVLGGEEVFWVEGTFQQKISPSADCRGEARALHLVITASGWLSECFF